MEERFQLIDFYIKDLDPDEQRGVAGDLRDAFTNRTISCMLDEVNGYQNALKSIIFDTVDDVKRFIGDAHEKFIKINERMMRNGRYPLFKDPYNLVESTKWLLQLLEFMPESECNKIVGCTSFDDYIPPVYKKD